MTKIFQKIFIIAVFVGAISCSGQVTNSSSPIPVTQPDPQATSEQQTNTTTKTPNTDKDQTKAGQTTDPAGDDGNDQTRPNGTQAETGGEEDNTPVVDPSQPGPYRAATYNQGLADSGYNSAVVYYPDATPLGLLPATTLVAGFTNVKEDILWIAEHLASHGFVVLAYTPSNNYSLDAADWSAAQQVAFRKLEAENTRNGSPIYGRINSEQIGLMGFSMGGAGTILAANGIPKVRTAVAFCPFEPVVPNGNQPMMLISGTADTVSLPELIQTAYSKISGTAPRALLSFRNLAHGDILRSSTFRDPLAKYFTAFMKSQLAQRRAYEKYLTSLDDQAERDQLFAVFDFQP